ncbi:MAG: EAL domain-containing protein [Bacillota bacterium]|nr:EAL domain-containing protein [Bacillota bacterium]
MNQNRRLSKKISISNLVILFMILLIILQSAMFISMTTISGTGKQLEINAVSYIAKNLSFNKLIVERSMSDIWGNIDNLYSVISKAKKEGLHDNPELQINLTAEMLSALQILKASGITVVLYNEGSEDTVISLLDYNPTVSSHNSADNTLYYGDERIAHRLGIKLDSDWSEDIYEDDARYFKEYKAKCEKLSTRAAVNASKRVSSWEYYNNNDGEKFWHYLVPLIGDQNYDPIGFLIVEVDLSIVMNSLHRSVNTDQFIKGYALLRAQTAQCQVGETVELEVMGTKVDEACDYFNDSTVKLKRINNDYEEEFESINSTFVIGEDYGEDSRCEFYLSSVKFINTEDYADYYLLVIVDKLEKEKPVKNFDQGIWFIIFGSFLIGALLTILLSNMLSANARRVTAQVRGLQKADEEINFEVTSISEFDMLLEEIRILRVSLRESADKFESIFALSEFPVVALEIDEKSGVVYKVGRVYDIVDIERDEGETDDFVKEVSFEYYNRMRNDFLTRYRKYISYKNEDGSSIDIWESSHNGRKHYVKIVTDFNEREVNDFSVAVAKNELTKTVILKVITDCTNEILEQNRIMEERDRDTLTGLLNRFSFKRRVDAIIAAENVKAAMVMWDLDDLKFVNDAYGHDAGDIYIKSMADILKRFEGEGAAVARISGDEFFAFLTYRNSKSEIRDKVKKVKEAMSKAELYFSDQKMSIKATAGIAWYPDDTGDIAELHKYADYAMYTGKHSVKGTIAEFNRKSFDNNYMMLMGNQHFENFIKERQAKFVYQPIVSAKNAEIVAYEALMRPTSEQIKDVATVLKIARYQHRLPEVEMLTMDMVLEDVVEYAASFDNRRVFINSIANTAVSEEDMELLEFKYGERLSKCVIEIVEEEDIEQECIKIKQNAKLKLSMQIAIDDYGNGNSGSAWLRSVQPDYLKIDMNLVRGIEKDQEKVNVVKLILEQAKKSNILTVCEGVETYAEMRTLIKLGVDYLQGYYLGKPDYEPGHLSDKIKEEIIQLHAADSIAAL